MNQFMLLTLCVGCDMDPKRPEFTPGSETLPTERAMITEKTQARTSVR